jgi:glycosyltransferase involved in cell wall biosynthesis
VQEKFAAVLGVKDELELLPECMSSLARIGVERVFAIDCGSTDGSREWLGAHAGDHFEVHDFDDRDADAAAWERLNLRLACGSGADWVLFLDADEFWIPATGRLSGCAGLSDSDVHQVPRYNVPLGMEGALAGPRGVPGPADELLLIVEPVPDFRSRLASEPELPWIRGVPAPKIMARPDRLAGLDDGGHAMRGHQGAELRLRIPDDLLIAHLPFTTADRFQRKLDNIRRVFEIHDDYFGEHLAWHWRRWLALADADAAAPRREFQRQAFDAQTLQRNRESGVVASAAEWFLRARAYA